MNSRKISLWSNANFVRLLIGQSFSQFGDRLHQVALLWLSYQLTDSATVVGVVATATALPYLFFGLIAGTITDRLDKRKVMLTTDLLRAALVLIIPILGWLDHLAIPVLILISFCSACVAQFFDPAKQASIPRIFASDALLAANATLASWQQLARLAAPVIAGLLMIKFSPYSLFVIDSSTFVISALMIWGMTYDSQNEVVQSRLTIKRQLSETRQFLQNSPTLRLLLIMYATVNLIFHGSSVVLPPIFADTVLHQGAVGYGAMLSSYTVGLLLGAIVVRRVASRFSILRIFCGAFLVAGCSYMLVGASGWLWLAMLGFALTGFFFNMVSITFVSLIQQQVPKDQQGAIFGAVGMLSMGVIPFSNMLASYSIVLMDIQSTFFVAGGLIACVGLFAMWNARMMREEEKNVAA